MGHHCISTRSLRHLPKKTAPDRWLFCVSRMVNGGNYMHTISEFKLLQNPT